MSESLPKLLLKAFTGNPWRSAFIGFLTLFFIPFFLGHYLPLLEEKSDLGGSLSSCISDKSKYESENKLCRDKLSAAKPSQNKQNEVKSYTTIFEDFKRDWDYSSDFYVSEGTQLLCPKEKGGRNFQRIYYKQNIVPKDTKLNLKFRMQDEKTAEYTQHFVVGIADGEDILTELDIPTRTKDGQTMSLRESSESGALVPRPPGSPLKSAIEEGSVVNLSHEIQNKVGRLVTQTTFINFVSKYGPEEDKFPTYDKELDDAKPENLPLKLFIGSYVGGCLEILDWSLVY